eukprot:3090418-Rhodomonas_salina.1
MAYTIHDPRSQYGSRQYWSISVWYWSICRWYRSFRTKRPISVPRIPYRGTSHCIPYTLSHHLNLTTAHCVSNTLPQYRTASSKVDTRAAICTGRG